MASNLDWILWTCPQCHLPRWTTRWWAKQGAKGCHHGQRMNIGTELNPIPLSFNPVEEQWYGVQETRRSESDVADAVPSRSAAPLRLRDRPRRRREGQGSQA